MPRPGPPFVLRSALPPDRRLRHAPANPDREEAGEDAEEEERPPAEARDDDGGEERRQDVADGPSRLHQADRLAPVRGGPGLGDEDRPRRPLRSQAEADERAPERQLGDGARRGRRPGEEGVGEDGEDEDARPAEPVGEDPRADPADGGGDERDRREEARLRAVEAELGADRREGERVEHHVHRVEHPARGGGEERAARLGRGLAEPGEAHGRKTPGCVSRASRSRSRRRASSKETGAKRTSSPGRSWARAERSAEITFAIFGYPPVEGCSTRRTIGSPPAGTWTAPATTPSVTSERSGAASGSPSSRTPVRLEEAETRKGRERNDASASGENQCCWGPGVTRRRRRGPLQRAAAASTRRPRGERRGLAHGEKVPGLRVRAPRARRSPSRRRSTGSRGRAGRRFRPGRRGTRGRPRPRARGRAFRRPGPRPRSTARPLPRRASPRTGRPRERRAPPLRRRASGPTSVASRAAAPSSFPRRRFPRRSACASAAPPGGTPSAPRPGRPRSWTVVRSPGERTRIIALPFARRSKSCSRHGDEPDRVAGKEKRRALAARIEEGDRRPPHEPPAAGRRARVEPRLASRDPDASGRHPQARRGETRRREAGRKAEEIGEAGREAEEGDAVRRPRVERDGLFGRESPPPRATSARSGAFSPS